MRWPNSVVCECHPLTEPGPCAAAALEQVYTGGFANGLPHGFGKLRYPSGDVLDGEFNQWQPSGRCTYSYAEELHDAYGYVHLPGSFYVGRRKAGLVHGCGIYAHPDGRLENQEWFADKLISRADNTAWLTPGTGIDATLLSGTSFLGFLGTLDVDKSLELWLNDGLNKDVKRLKEIIRQVHDDDGIKKSVPKKLTLQSLQKRIGVLFKWDPADEASKLQGPADAGQDTGGSSGCSPML